MEMRKPNITLEHYMPKAWAFNKTKQKLINGF